MMDKARQVVVLGAGGFIGSNLCHRLVADGYEVIGYDIQWPEYRQDLLEGTYCRWADLTIPEFTEDALRLAGTVFHFAADMGGVGYFHSSNDWSAAITNGIITQNVLRACSRFSSTRLIYASSACAAATEHQKEAGKAPKLTERDLFWGTPDQLYGAEKRYGAYMTSHIPGDGRVAIFHTIYGPGQEFEGERMKYPSAIAQKARKARDTGEIEIWGDGKQIRSYLYIDDAIDRIMRLAEATSHPGPVMIGSDKSWTCDEVADVALKAAGVKKATKTHLTGSTSAPTGVLARNADLTNWERRFGPAQDIGIQEGFTRFIEWLDRVDDAKT